MGTNSQQTGERQPEDSTKEGKNLDHVLISIIKRLAFPTFVLLFCLMYLNSTWNRLDLGTLVYPYTILVFTLMLLVVVYVRELHLVRKASVQRRGLSESIKRLLSDWKESIGVIVIALGYLSIMDIAGFFPSSLVAMAAIMYLGGVRSWSLIATVCIFTLVMVYILFVVVLGIRPPSGYIQIEFAAPW